MFSLAIPAFVLVAVGMGFASPINKTNPSLAARDWPFGDQPLGGDKYGALRAMFPNNMSESPCYGQLTQVQQGYNKWLMCQDTYIQKFEDYVGLGKVQIRPAGKMPDMENCAGWCLTEATDILTSASWHGTYGWECACYTGAPRTMYSEGDWFAYWIGTVMENNGRWIGSELLELPDGYGDESPEDQDWKNSGHKWPQAGRPGGRGWPMGNNWGIDPNY